MKRAAKLSSDDLLQLCVMKGVASQRGASDEAASGPACSAGANGTNPPDPAASEGDGITAMDRDDR